VIHFPNASLTLSLFLCFHCLYITGPFYTHTHIYTQDDRTSFVGTGGSSESQHKTNQGTNAMLQRSDRPCSALASVGNFNETTTDTKSSEDLDHVASMNETKSASLQANEGAVFFGFWNFLDVKANAFPRSLVSKRSSHQTLHQKLKNQKLADGACLLISYTSSFDGNFSGSSVARGPLWLHDDLYCDFLYPAFALVVTCLVFFYYCFFSSSCTTTHERSKEQDRKLASKTMDHKCLKCRYRVIHSLSTFKFSRPQQTQQQQQQQQMLIKGQTILLKQKTTLKQKEEHPSSKQSSVCSEDGMKHQASQKCGHIFGPRMFLIAIFSVSSFLSLLYFKPSSATALLSFLSQMRSLQNHFCIQQQ
jgi:hypothetical protein